MAKPGAIDMVQLATFTVGGQAYALDIMSVKEIIQPRPVTPVPTLPAFVEGVFELRGAVMPVIDLRKRFGLPAPPATRATKVVIATIGGQAVGLVVDGVGEVLRIAKGELSPPPAIAGGAATFFTAVCRREDRILFVIDVERVLSAEERGSLAGVASS